MSKEAGVAADASTGPKKYASMAEFYPFYSFAGDWVMWSEILRGKIKF